MPQVDNIGCARSIGFGYSYREGPRRGKGLRSQGLTIPRSRSFTPLLRSIHHHPSPSPSSDSRCTIATLSAELPLSTSRPDLSSRRPNHRARAQGWRSLACTCVAAPATMAEEQYAHPGVCLFTVLFKFSALAFYILCSVFIQSFVIQFVVTVFLIALDFWTVKNVSGRILVGLRWWNEVDEQGQSVWHFESLDQQTLETLNKKDSWLFWWTLYLTPVVWVALGIIAIIKFNFDYLLVVSIALILNAANIVGFTKCRKDAKKQIQQFATSSLASSMGSRIQSAFLSSV